MPSYIVKIKPEVDQYVYWSTIVDAPVAMGNREEMREYLLNRGDLGGPGDPRVIASPDRFDRADKTGTSSMDGFYAWDEDTFIVEQRGVVKREDIPELVRCMMQEIPYPHILLPFQDGRIVTWDADGNKYIVPGTEDEAG